jgi:hypothetical protein
VTKIQNVAVDIATIMNAFALVVQDPATPVALPVALGYAAVEGFVLRSSRNVVGGSKSSQFRRTLQVDTF